MSSFSLRACVIFLVVLGSVAVIDRNFARLRDKLALGLGLLMRYATIVSRHFTAPILDESGSGHHTPRIEHLQDGTFM